MKVKGLIGKLRLSHKDVAEHTGMTQEFVKQLSAGNRPVSDRYAGSLAALFRERAAYLQMRAEEEAAILRADAAALLEAADKMDPPTTDTAELSEDA